MNRMRVFKFLVIVVTLLAIPMSVTMLWGQELSSEAQAALSRAADYHGKGNFDRAIAECDTVIRLYPNNGNAYYIRGGAYIDKGDYDKAIADLTRAIQFDPTEAGPYNQRGFAYFQKKDYERAILDFNNALKYGNPNDTDNLFFRGCSYYYKANYDKAIADFEAMLRINPNNANAKQWLDAARQARGEAIPAQDAAQTALDRGYSADQRGDYNTAIAEYTEAIRLDPNEALAYGLRGIAYRNKGDIERAIADFTQAIRLDPNEAAGYYNRGIAYGRKGDWNRAIADYEAALRLEPNNAEYRQNLENARKQRGR